MSANNSKFLGGAEREKNLRACINTPPGPQLVSSSALAAGLAPPTYHRVSEYLLFYDPIIVRPLVNVSPPALPGHFPKSYCLLSA